MSAIGWRLHGDGKTVRPGDVVDPDERLTWPRTIGIGMQHVVAMFGATFLVPLLTGFSPATTLFFSAIGTVGFLLITRNRLPSYLGSSFAFIAPIGAATASQGQSVAVGGILVTGLVLAAVGLLVHVAGARWIDVVMPPIVTGTIVALIGLNLAPAAWGNFRQAPVTAVVTLAAIILVSVLFKGILGRLSILVGVVVGYVVAVIQGEVSFDPVRKAAWVGLPEFVTPTFDVAVLGLFVPVVLVLIAENVGHVRGVATMTEDPAINRHTGRALIADGVATTIAGGFGGSGTTTYGENIGVMAATRVYSTAVYWVAGLFAILLAFSPKVGEVFNSIPAGVLGGATTALYGLIGIIGIKIWVDSRVDFSRPVNQYTAAVSLVIGIAGFTMQLGDFAFGGIVLGTVAALLIYHLGNLIARARKTGADDPKPLEPVGPLGGDPA